MNFIAEVYALWYPTCNVAKIGQYAIFYGFIWFCFGIGPDFECPCQDISNDTSHSRNELEIWMKIQQYKYWSFIDIDKERRQSKAALTHIVPGSSEFLGVPLNRHHRWHRHSDCRTVYKLADTNLSNMPTLAISVQLRLRTHNVCMISGLH